MEALLVVGIKHLASITAGTLCFSCQSSLPPLDGGSSASSACSVTHEIVPLPDSLRISAAASTDVAGPILLVEAPPPEWLRAVALDSPFSALPLKTAPLEDRPHYPIVLQSRTGALSLAWGRSSEAPDRLSEMGLVAEVWISPVVLDGGGATPTKVLVEPDRRIKFAPPFRGVWRNSAAGDHVLLSLDPFSPLALIGAGRYGGRVQYVQATGHFTIALGGVGDEPALAYQTIAGEPRRLVVKAVNRLEDSASVDIPYEVAELALHDGRNPDLAHVPLFVFAREAGNPFPHSLVRFGVDPVEMSIYGGRSVELPPLAHELEVTRGPCGGLYTIFGYLAEGRRRVRVLSWGNDLHDEATVVLDRAGADFHSIVQADDLVLVLTSYPRQSSALPAENSIIRFTGR